MTLNILQPGLFLSFKFSISNHSNHQAGLAINLRKTLDLQIFLCDYYLLQNEL